MKEKMSLEVVLPLLYSIINCEGNSLKQLQLSPSWRQKKDRRLTDFLVKYNQVLNTRSICSSQPDTCKAAHNTDFVWVPTRGSKYGHQCLLCYECNEHICVQPEESNDYKNFCIKCEKTLCPQCMPTFACVECKETSCFSCTSIGTCQDCHRITCLGCMPVLECPCCHRVRCDDCSPMTICSLCNNFDANCDECASENPLVEVCDFCEENFCKECRQFKFCDDCGELYCEVCSDTLHHDACSTAKRARIDE